MVQQLPIAVYYYDYQLSKARRKFGVQVSTFNFCFCHGELVSFPVATYWPFTSFAAKRGKLQARNIVTVILQLIVRNFVTKALSVPTQMRNFTYKIN